ncbi:MAG: sulfite exporter TauE/SafE family protein [Ruminiclostridium sp.]|nr:sulfite exporter TauE/SafE family protein [Ruminiclostridium sp.]
MNGLIPAAAGFLAGAAGSMGLGGGFVLILYLSWAGLSPEDARAANLLFFIPTAIVSVLINKRGGLIDTRLIPYAAAAGSIGAVIGLMISGAVDPSLLRVVFAVMIIAVGARELFHRSEKKSSAQVGKPAAQNGG